MCQENLWYIVCFSSDVVWWAITVHQCSITKIFGVWYLERKLEQERKIQIIFINICICVGFNMLQLLVKGLHNRRYALSYLNSMRVNLINNFLDVFGSKRALLALVSFFLLMSQETLWTFAAYEKPYLYSLSFQSTSFILILTTYTGHPPR